MPGADSAHFRRPAQHVAHFRQIQGNPHTALLKRSLHESSPLDAQINFEELNP
jgi:hypothetical protein